MPKSDQAVFFPAVAHDLRTPLTTLSIYSDLVLSRQEVDEKALRALAQESQKMFFETNALLDLLVSEVRTLNFDWEECSLFTIIQEAGKKLTLIGKSELNILPVTEEIVPIICDKKRLQQAFILLSFYLHQLLQHPLIKLQLTPTKHSLDVALEWQSVGTIVLDESKLLLRYPLFIFQAHRAKVDLQQAHGSANLLIHFPLLHS